MATGEQDVGNHWNPFTCFHFLVILYNQSGSRMIMRHQDIKWYPKQVRTSLLAKLHPAKFRKRKDTTSSLLVKDWSLTKTESVIQFRGFWNILNYQNSKIVWNSFPCKLAVWNLQFLLLNFGAAHQISKKRCTQGTFAPLLERPPWSRHCHPPPSCHPPR